MILADTSVWADHLRGGDARLTDLLERGQVAMHPFIVGEIAMGSLPARVATLAALDKMREVDSATIEEVRTLVERHRLYSRGIGLIDAHLLASALLTPGTRLWTRDRRLHAAAEELGIAAD